MQTSQCLKTAVPEKNLHKTFQASNGVDERRDNRTGKFKEAMRKLGSGAVLITTRCEARRFGMTATSLTSLSLSPPSLLICVNERASIHAPIAESGRFCINLLNRHQANLAQRFSIKPDGEARFEQGSWSEDEEGLPILNGCVANVACAAAQITSHGTHSIIIGNVLRVSGVQDGDPLLYLNGTFGRFTGV
jgi:flavin reductase